ncbi:MAG: Com family DNA-binding transcriptional regulator [Candidatus Pacebacteria bacterium]|nr:Com family DNA-binding transcriptional regulator [Candidatus Paceibacterota bacterium]
MLKEYRCESCNKLLFKGEFKEATIEIKCRNCKKVTYFKIGDFLKDPKGFLKP